MADAAETFLIDPSGQVVSMPADEAAAASTMGYVPASPKQIAEMQQRKAFEEKYGGTGSQLLTGTAAAARALTFGASDVALTQLKGAKGDTLVDPETLRNLKAANPNADIAGTVVGVAAPLVLSGGASGVAQAGVKGAASTGAKFTAPSLIAKAGRAVEGAVARALPEATTTAGKIASRAVSMGAGSAVEGAFYGAGNVVSEAALGDPHLTAESALAEIGLGAALGGGIGLGAGAIGSALSEFTPKDIGKKLAGWLSEAEGNRNIKAAGAIQSDISRATKQIGKENLNKLGQEMGELGLVGPLSTPETTLVKARELMKRSGDEMGAVLRQADELAAAKGAAPKIETVVNKMIDDVWTPLASNPMQKEAASRFSEVIDGYAQKYAGGMTVSDLHAARKEVSEALYGLRGNQDPFANSFKDALHDFRTALSDEIEASIKRIGLKSDAWKQANRTYHVAVKAEEFAERGIQRGVGNNLVSPTEFLGAMGGGLGAGPLAGLVTGGATAAVRRHASGFLGWAARHLRTAMADGSMQGVVNKTADVIAAERAAGVDIASAQAAIAAGVPESVAALTTLERMNQAAARRMSAAASAVVRGSVKAASIGRAEVLAGVPKVFGQSHADASRQFENRTEQISRLAGDPDQMLDTLEAQADGLIDHAPNTSQAMQVASSRAVSFLASKIPQHPPAGPLAPKWTPSPAEVATFNRYYEAVENPLSILKQAAAGTLTPEAIEAVSTVYPQLMDKMRASVIEKVTELRKPVPYKSRIMLSLLLGQSLDGTDSGGMIQRNQLTLQGPSSKSPENQVGGAIRPTSKGAGAITLSTRSQTPLQALASRR